MPDRYLITWFLNLNFLECEEPRRFDLENKLTIHSVGLAFFGWALNDWVKLFLVDNLIYLESTSFTCIDSNLHARFHIACSCHNTTHGDQRTNALSLDLTHLSNLLLGEFAGHKNRLESSFKLSWNSCYWVSISSRVLSDDKALLQFDLAGHLKIISTLLHDNVETIELLITEVHTRLWHISLENLIEELHISGCIACNSLNKSMVSLCTKSGEKQVS